MTYFQPEESIYSRFRGQVEDTLAVIADRYVGNNPPHPTVYRAFHAGGILRTRDYQYRFNLADRFPDMKDGAYVYAWAKMWCDQEMDLRAAISCDGPTRLYVNGQQVYRSSLLEELNPARRVSMNVSLRPGWNHFVLSFVKTASGCGGHFGPGSFKGHPFHLLTPSPERSGQEGWIYSEPLERELELLPGEGTTEEQSGVRWFPNMQWNKSQAALGQCERLFGKQSDRYAVAWTQLRSRKSGLKSYELAGSSLGGVQVYIDGKLVYESDKAGSFQFSAQLLYGPHALAVVAKSSADGWGFSWNTLPNGLDLEAPFAILGATDPWVYVGPLSASDPNPLEAGLAPAKVYSSAKGSTSWRIDMPDGWVRAYTEAPLFGKWNYPLGVTLYGLFQTAGELEREDLGNYVRRHIMTAAEVYEYALWDRDTFGASGVLHTLATLDSLDDCGSFGAMSLFVFRDEEPEEIRAISDRIAEYISNEQARMPSGALFRRESYMEMMVNTVWCDDLYMSVPFLCRQYGRTGDIRYLHDAAKQFGLYKELMYLPELQIMSHVYDLDIGEGGTATRVPWGRGNGWVLFSLSELLAVLPEDDEHRDELIAFFRELSQGYLRLQGAGGLWHQVLTDPESYEETSCTSMFMYAFARGIRYGWLEEHTEAYINAVFRGWEGICRISVDKTGNVYGVCRGSGYSFTPSYYKNDLSWLLNDTHGIGIVMLAGIETLRLRKWMESAVGIEEKGE
jgi:unsaturated rhamnogalacturonyl hydrolase